MGYSSGLAVKERGSRIETIDPAELATRLRQLALDVHRVLNDPLATTGELVELSRCIDELRRQARVSHFREIDRWLQSAGDLVRTRSS